MRKDMLELDTTGPSPVPAQRDLTLEEIEAIRLILSGGSVIDWLRLAFSDQYAVNRFLKLHLLDPDSTAGHARLRYVFNEAMSYLEQHLHFQCPRALRSPTDIRDVFVASSQVTGFRRTQIFACILLKVMHVIHHLEAADLKFKTLLSEEAILDLARDRVLEAAQRMADDGIRTTAFYGSKKTRASIITKLISKKENVAATVFDKLRFRVVVESYDDIATALAWLTQNLIPFNYIIPGQSHNNLLDPDDLISSQRDKPSLQDLIDYPVLNTTSKNEFSGGSYRMINFIADLPVMLPPEALPDGFTFEFGNTVFVMVEFQIVDQETEKQNQSGENAHALYKERQREVVTQRLKRGLLER